MTLRRQDGRINPGVALGLGVLAVALFVLNMRGCGFPFGRAPWQTGILNTGFWHGQFYGLLGIWGLIQGALAVWVGLDAKRRGQNGVLWGFLVFFTGIVGLVVYLIVVPNLLGGPGESTGFTAAAPPATPGRTCPGCSTAIQQDFKVCPYCGVALSCRECGTPLQGGWKVCPGCATPVPGS
jgi:RNA polymerase subunit RPABC4/transcription elongation factor Spt4